MLASWQHEHNIRSRVEKLFAVLCAIDLDLPGAGAHNGDRARITLIGDLQSRGRGVGGTQIAVEIQDAQDRVFLGGFDHVRSGRKPQSCFVPNGPETAIYKSWTEPRNSHAVARIHCKP